jgi:membrane peptidoglycan carboxypeptidase
VHALQSTLPGPHTPEAAVVAVDPRTGDIRAMTTKQSGGYKKGGFNLARDARRSSGSTIKPFTLALALQHGHTLDEPHAAPQCVTVAGGRICNAEQGSSYQTLRTALIHSINTVYGPLGIDLGIGRVVKLMRKSGVTVDPLQKGDNGKPFPAQALGVQVAPLGEAVGFGTIVNHGVHHGPRSVLRVNSELEGVLYEARSKPRGDRAIPRGVADQVTTAMQGVVDGGTGTRARQPFPVFGKTGTTDDFTNAWFTGCTRTLCIAVWMGYDKPYLNHGRTPHSMVNVAGQPGGVYGGTLPAQIFARTWSDYRILQQPKGSLSPTPTATVAPPAVSTTTAVPPRQTAEPRHTKSSEPTPEPTKDSPKPTPSPTPTSSLLPTTEPDRVRQ